MVGPVNDEKGLEQGKLLSSDLYKQYNNELLRIVQSTNLGVPLGSSVVSAVGQADDTGLLSNNLYRLNHILQLALEYCVKYNVQLCQSKTKLLQI